MMGEALFQAALPATLVVPLLWVILSLLSPGRVSLLLTSLGVVLQSGASVLLWFQVAQEGSFYYALANWEIPRGIALRVDGLAVTFVLLTAVVASGCALHAHLYFRDKQIQLRSFWPLFWFLWAGLNSIWLSDDLFNLYVSLELVAFCAVGLVAVTGEPQALSSALRYLLAAVAGSLSYLLGVALIYGGYGSLSIPILVTQIEPGLSVSVALALMAVGLMFKTALFPLHGWLPPAHGGALAPVSALLSALVIKASFYLLARLWLDLGAGVVAALIAQLIGLLGTLAIFWGSWKALQQRQLKMVVAYSTVAQVGYFFLFFPLVTGVSEAAAGLARDGAMLLVIAHALAKSALFLAAGNLIASVGRDEVDGLFGVSRFRPMSLFSFALASVTLMGLPPSGGFTAKWLLLQSALASNQWHWIAVIILGTLATAAYMFRIFHKASHEGPQSDVFDHPSRWMEAVPMVLALVSILVGLLSAQLLAMFEVVPVAMEPES